MYDSLFVIYYKSSTTNKLEPRQIVSGLTNSYFNKKDAEKDLEHITKQSENYEIVEYIIKK